MDFWKTLELAPTADVREIKNIIRRTRLKNSARCMTPMSRPSHMPGAIPRRIPRTSRAVPRMAARLLLQRERRTARPVRTVQRRLPPLRLNKIPKMLSTFP